MPNPSSKKERLARFISRLRSKRTSGSSLVVQTGFPTSIADLVVKNRAKFKKRKKPSLSSDLDSTVSVAVRSESDGSDDCLAPAVECPNRIDGEIRRRGVGLLMVKVAALVVVAVGRKWVVAGITILAFGLLGLELVGLLKPRSRERNAIERFDLGGRGSVSPIREVEDHQNSECLDSRSDVLLKRRDFDAVESNNKDQYLMRPRSNERNCSETDIEAFDLRGLELVSPIRELQSQSEGWGNSEGLNSSDILLESRVFDALGNIIMNQDLGNSRKSKRKKLFRKLFKRKNRQRKDEELSSSLNGSRVSNEVLIEEEQGDNGDDVKENSDEEFFSFEAYDEVMEIDREDVNEIGDNGGEIRLRRWKKLVFFIVVLLGLLGGRSLALVLTVVWYLLSGCTGTMWRKWKMQ